MSTKSNSHLSILVGGWLVTAVATFCLGRVTSNPVSENHSTNSRPGGSGSAASGGSSASTGSTQGSGGNSSEADDVIGRVFGSHATSLEQVLNGKSLGDHVKHLLKVDDEATRMLGFLRLLEALNSPEDIKAALETISGESGGRFRMTEQSMLLQKWAKTDPKAAATYTNGLRDFSRFTGINAVLRTWLKVNSDEAIAWAEQNGAPSGEEGQGGRGPGRGGPDDGNWAVASMIGPLAEQNLDRAIQLASNQPVSRARGRMIDTLVEQMITQRGEETARNSIADMPDSPFRVGMAGQLADKMAAENPETAAKWASTLPTGDTRERALSQAIREWASKDIAAAGTYLQTLGNTPDLDDARQTYAMTAARQDPQAALPWAQSISDPKQQSEAVNRVLGMWARTDKAAATDWAAANGLPAPQASEGGGRGFRNR